MLLAMAEAAHGARPERAGARGAGRWRDAGRRTGAAGLTATTEPGDAARPGRDRPPAGRGPRDRRASCTRSTAASSARRPAATCCARPAILPTGRNLHGFDPFRIPSAFAVQDGARQAAAAARPPHGRRPRAARRSIAIVLWGTDNLKNEGGPIAQALALMGARPALRRLRPPGRRRADRRWRSWAGRAST